MTEEFDDSLKTLPVRVPDHLREWLEDYAARHRWNRSVALRVILEDARRKDQNLSR